MAALLTASERRKKLKLKRIVVSEHNYLSWVTPDRYVTFDV